MRMRTKYGLGYHEIQHCIAEELEPFVIGAGSTAMRERLLQQSGIFELIIQFFL